MTRFAALFLLPLLTAVALAQSPALPARDAAESESASVRAVRGSALYRQLLPSVAFVRNSAGSGSGWILDTKRKLLVTNHHVVIDSKGIVQDEVQLFFPHYGPDGRLIAEKKYYLDRASRLAIKGRVIDTNPRTDLAIIQAASLPSDAVALKLSRDGAGPADRVHAVGSPGVSGGLWGYTAGGVRQVYEYEWTTNVHSLKLPLKARVVETFTAINPGDSGGPLVNDAGELVGVTQGNWVGASGMSVFIDVDEVRRFADDSGWMAEVQGVRELVRRGRHYLDRGRLERAIADLNRAIELEPNSFRPYEYRGDARRKKGDRAGAAEDYQLALRKSRFGGVDAAVRERIEGKLSDLSVAARGDRRN